MGDDGLLGGTTSVDDLKLTGNISTSTNTSIIGGQYIFSFLFFIYLNGNTNVMLLPGSSTFDHNGWA